MKEIGVGVLGCGTVGSGVVAGLRENAALLAERLGVKPVVRKIAVRDLATKRDPAVPEELLTSDAGAVIDDPSVDIVVELIGGSNVARTLVKQALEAGKPVVTANKKLLAEHGRELFTLAAEKGVDLYFESSIAGAIPIVRALREGLVGDHVRWIRGILNGTCNYILTRMENEGLDFEAVLEDAQKLGYAEADPSTDIDGYDTAHKAALLASLAYGFYAPLDEVLVEGIRGLAGRDVEYAADLGYRIKLLAVIKKHGEEVELRVHPALVPTHDVLASVSDAFNAVMVNSDLADDTLYYGRGAGQLPTASAVISDIGDLARHLASSDSGRMSGIPLSATAPTLRPIKEIETRYYLRLDSIDRPGVLAQIMTQLGDRGVSIASTLQKEAPEPENPDAFLSCVIVTHHAKEAAIDAALEGIAALEVVDEAPVKLRIED